MWLGTYHDAGNWARMDEVGRDLNLEVVDADNFRWVPVRLRTGVEYDEVLGDVAAQLRRIGEIVRGSAQAESPPS